MAWITKNSAATQIERRDTPYLDDQLQDELRRVTLPQYPTKMAATLPVLWAIQRKHGYLPDQSLEEAAAFLDLEPSQVADTASFYDQFYRQPKGKYLIYICQSLSCEIMGQPALLKAVCEKLGVEPGGTTDDGKFTVQPFECLGSCGTAPCALVNEKLHENLTVENFAKILDDLP